ncbi:MAG: hypothetical protein AB7K09_12925 [Planctomycetota bacterium]
MRRLLATIPALACVAALLAACSPDTAGTAGPAGPDGPTAAGIYETDFRPAFQHWEAARASEAERLEAVREDWNAETRNLLQLAEHERLLTAATAERVAAEERVSEQAARVITGFPWSYQSNRVQTEFIAVLRDEVSLLVQRRASLREQYARPLHPSEHRLIEAESEQLEDEIASRLTALQRRFNSSPIVGKLEDEVLRPRYEELMKSLANFEPETAATPAGVQAGQAQLLLSRLAELKRRYPLSDYTRKAEKHIVPRTAPRALLDLRGWPAAVFFCCLALLLLGFGRCLAGYIANRQKEEEAAASRVFRAAPWVRSSEPAWSAAPASSESAPTPPTAPRRPGVAAGANAPRVPGEVTPLAPKVAPPGAPEAPAPGAPGADQASQP